MNPFGVQRRTLLKAAAAGLCGVCGSASAAFPDRPITIVVPYAPGASTDLLARTLQPGISSAFGQTVIVENRAGASGNIAVDYVIMGPADGSRILLATEPIIVMNPHLFSNLRFDPTKELVPLGNAATAILALAVHPSVPASNVAEFIAWGRKQPEGVPFGTAGIGTPHHVNGIIFGQRTGVNMVHVPYKGSGPMTNDLLGGTLKAGISTLSTLLPFARSGKLKILGVGELSRVPSAPDIPSISETVPGFLMSSWVAFFAPARTPDDVVQRWNVALMTTLHSQDVAKKLDDAGLPVLPANKPAELAERIKHDFPVYGKVIKEAGIRVD